MKGIPLSDGFIGHCDDLDSMAARDMLNKLKWDPKLNLKEAEVTITHRGAPGDILVIKGSDILELRRGFMRIASREGGVDIPYHRIQRIEVNGKLIWRKRGT